jgi:hypothetical protein
MFRIKRLTPLANRSATWTAVTQFTKTRSESLYHTARPDPSEAATFTPAPTAEGGAVTTEVEPEKKEPDSEEDEPSG